MPNRILRDVCDSEKLNAVGVQAERLFYRLIQKVDDFGRLASSPRTLRPLLYPLQLDTVREADLSRWIAELDRVRIPGDLAGLIRLYEVDGRGYLYIVKWKQQIRAKESKFPSPDDERPPSTCASDAQHMRPTTKTKAYAKTTTETDVGVGVDSAGGDSLDSEIRAFISGHRLLTYDPKTHANCRRLVEIAGWDESRVLIDEAVAKGSSFPVGWALGKARNSESRKGAANGEAEKPRTKRPRVTKYDD